MHDAGTVSSVWQHPASRELAKGAFQEVRSAARRNQQLGIPTVRQSAGICLRCAILVTQRLTVPGVLQMW